MLISPVAAPAVAREIKARTKMLNSYLSVNISPCSYTHYNKMKFSPVGMGPFSRFIKSACNQKTEESWPEIQMFKANFASRSL